MWFNKNGKNILEKPLKLNFLVLLKALANEDTLLGTHCCRHKCFPVCPSTHHLLRTQILCPGHKQCFLFRNILCRLQMLPSLRSPRNIMGNKCVGNSVSSFARALTTTCFLLCIKFRAFRIFLFILDQLTRYIIRRG